MTDNVKHKPATPLPFVTTSCDEEFRANAEEGRKYRAEQERRANAYPLLVKVLRKLDAECDWDVRNGLSLGRMVRKTVRALLAELGE